MLLAPILTALILVVAPTGSQEKYGEIVGSAVFMNSETGEFVENAPNVTLELDFKGRSIQLRSDEFATLSKSLPAGTYCLKSAHDASNKPLRFSSDQHKCFKIVKNRDTRFDVMLLRS